MGERPESVRVGHKEYVMKLFPKMAALVVAMLIVAGCSSGTKATNAAPATQPQRAKLAYEVEDTNAPVVYFTKDVSAQGLLKVYKALNQEKQGKVGIKVSFGGATEQYLNPQLLTELVKDTQGTFLDTCGFTPPRDTPQGNYNMAKEHGFTDVAPVDIIDAEGDLDMPVNGGYHLKFARTGSHFANYDTLISVHRFKGHYIPIYGGTMKNISLAFGSLSGHALIHSAGTNERSYERKDQTTTAQAFADAAKAAVEYKKGCWAFINVMDAFDPTDKCQGTKNLGDIGIIASLDPVAVDQAACDFVYGAAADEKTRQLWEGTHSVEILEHAEKINVGQRHYQLKEI